MSGEKNVKIITDMSFEEICGYIPEDIRSFTEKSLGAAEEMPFLISLDEEGEVTGICIFMIYKANKRRVQLVYLNVEEKYRGKGYGRLLIEQGIGYFRQRGYRYLLVETRILPGIEVGDFLNKAGFSKAGEDIYLTYSQPQLRESWIGKNYDQLKQALKNVKYLDEIPAEAVQEFRRSAPKKQVWTDISKLDPNLSVFFVNNKTILGFMSFCMDNDNSLMQIDSYISNSKAAKNAFPALVSEMIGRVLEEDEFEISLYITDKSYKGPLEKLLGKPAKDRTLSVYSMGDLPEIK